MKRINQWAIALSVLIITFIPYNVFAGPMDWAMDKAVGGTKKLVVIFLMTLWGHGKAVFYYHFLPSEDNMVLGCIAIALTLLWVLGFKKTRNWAGRLSKLSWGLVIILMVRNISNSMWENAEWWGKLIIGALAIAGVFIILFAIIPAIFKALTASLKSVMQLFNSNPSTFSCIMGAILLAGIINGEQMSLVTGGFASVLSSLAGVGFLGWKGLEFYKKRRDGVEEKPKPEKSDEPTEEVSEVKDSDEGIILAQCPTCGKMSMGEAFCDECGAGHENVIALKPTKSVRKQEGRGRLKL